MAIDNGKTEFIAHLFEEQAGALVKYLTARFADREAAREIAQEAWLRMYRLEHPQTLDNPRAFLFQTASNLAIDQLRRARLEQRHAQAEVDEPLAPDVMQSVHAQRELDIVNQALTELPLKCRQAFVMHRSNGLSYPEIARELGVSTSMVEKYIIQTLKHFRNRLTRHDR